MTFFGKPAGDKYHTRTIEVNTYEYDEERLVVAGTLTDHRWKEYRLATGEKRDPGILHQMIIHLLLNKSSLEIDDLHVEMPGVPRAECLETRASLDPVKGMRIIGGFTSKVKGMAGKGQGCSHLVTLLTAMGSAAIQGFAAYKLHKSQSLAADMTRMLVDSCWTWRAGGPLIRFLKTDPDKPNRP
ncbi:MAG TPA: DUF2889 domain-containing protein [Syntrophales bacterium]|nr:DUF2889 domain-containing protein [Syntrophales bacterium]